MNLDLDVNRRLSRRVLLLGLPFALAACTGVPLSAVPRLYRLQGRLLELDPAALSVAIQVDARLMPPSDGVPRLKISVHPARPGGFEPIDSDLPLQMERASPERLAGAGLAQAPRGRQWLIYAMPPATQGELRRIQAEIRRLRAAKADNGGGSMRLSISQAGMAPRVVAVADTEWQTWVRTAKREPYWALWSGTVGELRARAGELD